jgi:DNA repair protein RadC
VKRIYPNRASKEASPKRAKTRVMEMCYLDREQMRILILDIKNQVVDNINRYQGTVNSSVLRAIKIYQPAITRNCPGVIICHNHPGGDPTPFCEFEGEVEVVRGSIHQLLPQSQENI